MSQTITLRAQVEEAGAVFVAREKAIRFEVSRGTMREGVAELHIARMRAALATLQWMLKHEDAIKAKVDAVGASQ